MSEALLQNLSYLSLIHQHFQQPNLCITCIHRDTFCMWETRNSLSTRINGYYVMEKNPDNFFFKFQFDSNWNICVLQNLSPNTNHITFHFELLIASSPLKPISFPYIVPYNSLPSTYTIIPCYSVKFSVFVYYYCVHVIFY